MGGLYLYQGAFLVGQHFYFTHVAVDTKKSGEGLGTHHVHVETLFGKGGGWVGGWVGDRKEEEIEAVRMSCWTPMGGWVGGWVGGLGT